MKETKNVSVQQISLKDLFKSNFFSIPEYQRGYSWGKAQRTALWEDIVSLLDFRQEESYKHYMGTIVAVKGDEFCHYEIVDGQQRITSLLLLINTIISHKKFPAENHDSKLKTYINRNNEDVFRSGLQSKILANVFNGNLCFYDNKKLIQQDQNILDAVNEFDDLVELYLNKFESNLLELLSLIENQLGLIFFVPAVKSVAGRMFEVINNRGKSLSELDKIKNYFVYVAEIESNKTFINKIKDNWGEVLENMQFAGFVSTEEENEFLRYCWIVFGSSNKSKSYHIYKSLKSQSAKENDKIKYLSDFFDFIHLSSIKIKELFNAYPQKGSNNSDEVYEYEKLAIQLNITKASVMPLVLAVLTKQTDSQNTLELIRLIEILNFRYYVTEIANRNDTGQGELYKWANWYFKGLDEKKNIFGEVELKKNVIKFMEDNAKDDLFVNKLILQQNENMDFYHWKGLLYFLSRYELSLRDNKTQTHSLKDIMPKRLSGKSNDHSEREHIWSKKLEVNKIPRSELEFLIGLNKNRLGNFTLLRRDHNSEAGKKPINEKLKTYHESTRYMTRNVEKCYKNLNKKVFDKKKGKDVLIWTKLLDKLEENLVNFALKEWAFDPQVIRTVDIRSFDYDRCRPHSETFKIKYH
ncbi:DUF262 domain-containing protein [Marinicella litoralis]|uniref:Uncharacterized protein with ParB-like and HNH nuclease domain n=1 Tax=Marinicella litoralis TaxID=644220 RepID=A0A4R6XHC0_9GAMM|nr:DUF262 domain-containing protein [Marinicella litoralis]TDR16747.1 uncharacterized protein with ParB-like and HNH nuclease domain [Marinicella litoralis]